MIFLSRGANMAENSSSYHLTSSRNWHNETCSSAKKPVANQWILSIENTVRNIVTGSAVPRIFFGGGGGEGSTNSVEDRGQRERGSGCVAP